MRCLTLFAVSGVRLQIGANVEVIRAPLIAEIGRLAKLEAWSRRSVLRHCCRCRGLLHVGSCTSMKRCAASLKTIAPGERLASRASYLTSIGSLPSKISCRARLARVRASARLTVCSGPKPICRARPSIMYRNNHAFVPLDEIAATVHGRRYSVRAFSSSSPLML